MVAGESRSYDISFDATCFETNLSGLEEKLSSSAQIFPLGAGSSRVWVKKRRPGKNPLGMLAQYCIFRLTRIVLAVHPGFSGCRNNVVHESSRLRELAAAGIMVPPVLRVTDDYFVMGDCGQPLNHYCRENPLSAPEFILRAARELRRLHAAGFAHGGAHIKNLTVLGDRIGFIDLEEGISARHLHLFQIRDLFLFLFSLEREGFNPDPAAICHAYDPVAWPFLQKAVRQLRLVKIMDNRLLRHRSMRDIRAIIRLVNKVG